MKARVTVMLKEGVLDPQGEAVKHALNSLKYNKVNSVRQGKIIEMVLDETSKEKANKSVQSGVLYAAGDRAKDNFPLFFPKRKPVFPDTAKFSGT